MKSKWYTLLLLFLIIIIGCGTEKIEKLAGDFQFTEGPAAEANGDIYFTDIPNNRIHKWTLDGSLSTFRENSGGANGLYFDKEGNLFICEGGNRRLTSLSSQGELTILAEQYDEKKLNSPNDLWLDPKGGIYFTDPRYGNMDNLEQDGEHVYYLTPERDTLIRVINDMTRPNGVIGTPDGKLLYVADQGANETYKYTINPDGTLSNKELFVKQGSDGMTIDAKGYIYITGEAVLVYNPIGDLIRTIEVPERPSNVCFGGKDKKTLFITARTSFYSIKMDVEGL
jgi:gluconolactonase